MALSRTGRIVAAVSIASTLATGCVSIKLGPGPGERSTGVQFAPPTEPFSLLPNTKADGAWQNKNNGNSISYYSTCNDPADPPLETVTKELFADLKDLKTLQSQTVTFNGREGLESEVEGQIDGVSTRIHALVYKKNNCLYTLSYIALTKSFDEDKGRFLEFMRSFQAP